YLTFFLPVVSHQIGPYMFVGSGLVSLLVITLLLYAIARIAPEIVRREQTRVARSIAIIFIIFNALYFTNAIPPLPLALKDGGVYHSVTHNDDGTYTLQYEPLTWYQHYLRYNTVIHISPSDPVFVWTSIFAPSGLSTTIFHQWQHYDVASGKWQTL